MYAFAEFIDTFAFSGTNTHTILSELCDSAKLATQVRVPRTIIANHSGGGRVHQTAASSPSRAQTDHVYVLIYKYAQHQHSTTH